jgi:putative acetyltransferase
VLPEWGGEFYKKGMLEIIEASPREIALVRELFLEYASTLEFDLGFQGFDKEILELPGNYSAPTGCILLAYQDSEVAGCVALKFCEQGIGEMKRLYVRPQFQGCGIGRALVTSILQKAVALEYQKLRLDTVPSMKTALHMYLSMGFYSIPPYRENPIPGTTYLEHNLQINASKT